MRFSPSNLHLLWLLVLWLPAPGDLVAQDPAFDADLSGEQLPWTLKGFDNDPEHFQFAIVSDRTGGHRPGVFGDAVGKLNLLRPEFVMSVGDLIEGYTKDTTLLRAQWSEFDSLLDPLAMRFFFVPGNHDISNAVMRRRWLDRHGRSYYHFLYKDVLFLAFDSNDGDASATFSREQIDYFLEVLRAHPEVRWTLLFMHHPIWMYSELNGFDAIEAELADRPYTVFAGHFHRYMQALRKERNYYVLATTGGGSNLAGPKFGRFDHVTWVTMGEKGPSMVNITLDGLLEHDISTMAEQEKAQALVRAAEFQSLMALSEDKTRGDLVLGLRNDSNDSLFFDGRMFHHHHLEVEQSVFAFAVPPASARHITVPWSLDPSWGWERSEPLELEFSLGYRSDTLDHPFRLTGTYAVPKVLKEDHIRFSGIPAFLDERVVDLKHDFEELVLRYTTDGSEPTAADPVFDEPLTLTQTTTLRAALFTPEGANRSSSLSKVYRQVSPLAPVEVAGRRSGLSYAYYEGQWQQLPDFQDLQPDRTGVAEDFDVERIAGDRIDHYAIRYTGYVEVPEEGLYAVESYSDDGSRVYIGNELVVDNDGSHSARWRKGYVALEAGLHPIRIEYFEDFLGQVLEVYLQPAEAEDRQPLSFDALSHR